MVYHDIKEIVDQEAEDRYPQLEIYHGRVFIRQNHASTFGGALLNPQSVLNVLQYLVLFPLINQAIPGSESFSICHPLHLGEVPEFGSEGTSNVSHLG